MGVLAGPLAALRGARLLLQNPALIPLALVPAILTCLVSFLGVGLAIAYGDNAFALLWPDEPDNTFLLVLWTIGAWFVRALATIAVLFLTPWLVMLIGLPLCGPLAEKADTLLGGASEGGSVVGDIAASVKTTVGMTAIGLAGGVALFFLGLVPGLAVFTTPFTVLVWTPLFLAFDLADPVLSRRRFGFFQKVRTVLRSPVSALSLGLVGTVLLAVPVVNLLGLPIAVLAGVSATRRLEENGRLAPP
ncbi:MAG: EI24 domain-containing protein [Myxococcales bacterium]|nr:EI24 domain-containing protein [Myxococcales bacterium]